jgi:WD40 repeat protein
MTLRGHTAPVPRVVISPNGADVITVSEDGTAQVGRQPALKCRSSSLFGHEYQVHMAAQKVHGCLWVQVWDMNVGDCVMQVTSACFCKCIHNH